MNLVGFPDVIRRVENPRDWSHKQMLILFTLCANDSIGPLLPSGVDLSQVQRLPQPILNAETTPASVKAAVSKGSVPEEGTPSKGGANPNPILQVSKGKGVLKNGKGVLKKVPAQVNDEADGDGTVSEVDDEDITPYPTPSQITPAKNPLMDINSLISCVPKPNFGPSPGILDQVSTKLQAIIEDDGMKDDDLEDDDPCKCDVPVCKKAFIGKCEQFGCYCDGEYCKTHIDDKEQHDRRYAV